MLVIKSLSYDKNSFHLSSLNSFYHNKLEVDISKRRLYYSLYLTNRWRNAMGRRSHLIRNIMALTIILLGTTGLLSASRTVSSQMIHIWAYIPPATMIEVADDGEVDFTSNIYSASLNVSARSDSTTLLSVIAL